MEGLQEAAKKQPRRHIVCLSLVFFSFCNFTAQHMESPASASVTATATASKKRKLSHDHHHNHEETKDGEDEEMEEFFALVRSIREARDRLKINHTYEKKKQTENGTTEMKRKLGEDKQPIIEAWKPTFEREDFLVEVENPPQLIKKVPHVSLPSSSQNKEATDQKANQDIKDQGLDLTLSL